MLQKTEASYRKSHAKVSAQPRLCAADKGLLRLAVIDDDDRVLHVSCANGALISLMTKKHRCQFCGTTHDLEKMRAARETLPEADVLYCQPDEIPWRDESFSVLMCSMPFYEMDDPGKMLSESLRVLKPGGQILLALPWYPAPLNHLMNYMARQGDLERTPVCYTRQEAVAALEVMGFESVTWHAQELGSAVVVGWKAK